MVGCGMGRTAGFSIVVAGAKGRAVELVGLVEKAGDWNGVGCRQERISLPRCGGGSSSSGSGIGSGSGSGGGHGGGVRFGLLVDHGSERPPAASCSTGRERHSLFIQDRHPGTVYRENVVQQQKTRYNEQQPAIFPHCLFRWE